MGEMDWSERQSNRETGKTEIFHLLVDTPVPTAAEAGSDQSQEPGAQHVCPTHVAGTQHG